MADNVDITAGTGTTIAADEVTIGGSSVKVQRVKLIDGTDGGTDGLPGDATNGLDVDVTRSALPSGAATSAKQPALGTAGTPSTDVISVQGISSGTALRVDTAQSGSGTATGAIRVELPTNGTGVIATVGAVTAISNALPAGSNAIGKLAANSGVDIGDVDVMSVVPGTAATSLGKAEDSGHTSGDVGVMALGIRNETLATIAGSDLDYTPTAHEISGRVCVTRSPAAAQVRGKATATDTTSTSVVSASGSGGLKTYITGVQVVNTGATTVLVTLQDGSGGTALAYMIAPAGGGMVVSFETPLVTTANTALYFAAGGSTSTLYVSAQGYNAP